VIKFNYFRRFVLTGGGVHRTAIAYDQTIPRAALTQLKERVLDLYHRAQKIFLKFECCNIRTKENAILYNECSHSNCYSGRANCTWTPAILEAL